MLSLYISILARCTCICIDKPPIKISKIHMFRWATRLLWYRYYAIFIISVHLTTTFTSSALDDISNNKTIVCINYLTFDQITAHLTLLWIGVLSRQAVAPTFGLWMYCCCAPCGGLSENDDRNKPCELLGVMCLMFLCTGQTLWLCTGQTLWLMRSLPPKLHII